MGAVCCVIVAACSHESAQPTMTPGQVENASLGCPLSQPAHVDAAVMDVPGGVSVTFTGPTPALDRIRANVHAMQDANDSQGNAFAVCPCLRSTELQYGMESPADVNRVDDFTQSNASYPYAPPDQGQTMMQAQDTPAEARVDDIPTGAMLVLKPKDPSQLAALRQEVHERVRAMQVSCPAR